jgi:MYXO-CTERM domain-containing protein
MRPFAKRGALSLLGLACVMAATRPAHAAATFTLEVADEAGVGFNDMTVATPVGGNMGTTLGAQRRIAFQHALDIWGKALDSPIPIIVTASFGPLECTGTNVVLGQAGPTFMERDVPGQDPELLFPEALADRLAGVDITPGIPDIQAEFNGDLGACFEGMDWYYGLDAKASDNTADLIMTILHEIGHGLGFLSAVDETTGELTNVDAWDPFTAQLLDVASGMRWPELTAAQRLTSMGTARGLVWAGQYGNAAAATWLTAGAPRIRTTPEVPGLRDALIDVNFGRSLTTGPMMGQVIQPSPPDFCQEVTGVSGMIAILPDTTCHPLNQLAFVEMAGAVGGIVVSNQEPPPALDQSAEDLAIISTALPVVGMMKADADRLLAMPGVNVEIYADMTRRTGTDAMGRVYVFASNPVTNSSASHIDPAVRPDAVLEPSQTANIHHDVTLERAMLRDIGWATTCGNGMLDAGEQCDNGTGNSDSMPNACRTSCLNPKCGDAVVDTGEQCDPGVLATPCNMNCTMPVCGDGMVSMGEQCDNGGANSDVTPDACRTTCKRASCGDGVVDAMEACDAMTPTCQQCAVVSGAGGGAGAGVGTGGTSGSGGTATSGGSAGMLSMTGGAGPGAGGTGNDDDDDEDDGKSGGCGCQIPGAGGDAGSRWAIVAGALAAAAARRRRWGRA